MHTFYQWAASISGKYDDYIGEIEIDLQGNLYLTGTFTDTTDFDPDTASAFVLIPIPNKINKYFAKYDSDGNFLWVKRLLSPSATHPLILKLDTLNNIYICGEYRDSIDMDPSLGTSWLYTKHPYTSDIFFAKYDFNGNFSWAKSIFTTETIEFYYSMDVDEYNHIYISGRTKNGADFDPSADSSNLVFNQSWFHPNVFISQYDWDGNYKWAKQIESTQSSYFSSIKCDKLGNIIGIGYFSDSLYYTVGNITYGVFGGTNNGDWNSFFVKIDSSGNYKWVNYIASAADNYGTNLTIDNESNVLALGTFRNSGVITSLTNTIPILINPPPLNLFWNNFLIKFNESGQVIWAKNYSVNLGDHVTAITIDTTDNIYVTGNISTPTDFDIGQGISEVNSNKPSPFLAKYDKDFNLLWADKIGEGMAYPISINLTRLPEIYLSGNFAYGSEMNLDPTLDSSQTINRLGGYDSFFAKYVLDSCSDFSVNIDSVKNILCGNIPGEASSFAAGGIAPYTLSWNTIPISNATAISTLIPRYYTITAVDSRGCMSSKDVHIDGPYQNDFDLKVNLVTTAFRPGTASAMWIDVFNNGCTPTAGSVMMILDTAVNFNSSNPGVNNFNGDTIIWNFGNLDYLTPHFQPLAIVGTSTLIAAPATELIFDLVVFPFNGDADTSNNRRRCHVFTFNSGDPNEKLVYPIGDGPLGKITNNQTMTYTVHFQNTGNAEAYNISILDTIDSDLDFQSLRVVGSSHPISATHLLKDNLVRFNFNNINLPDSATDQLGSNGYVMYEIEQKANLPYLTQITNTAHIYFDFNPAIITNTVLNTIDLSTSVLEKKELESAVTIYPNPVTKSMSILLDKLDENSKVLIYDAQGRQIKLPFAISKNQIILDTKDLQQGIYNAVITFPKTGKSRSCKFIRM